MVKNSNLPLATWGGTKRSIDMDKWIEVSKDKIETTEFMTNGIIERVKEKTSYRVSPGEMSNWDGIPEDTMRKILNGRCAITRHFLSKFTVGLKIDIEIADKLFELYSGRLNPENKFDFIVICALRDGDDFSVFYEDVKRHCDINLLKERGSKE